jgi:hypothetical protein
LGVRELGHGAGSTGGGCVVVVLEDVVVDVVLVVLEDVDVVLLVVDDVDVEVEVGGTVVEVDVDDVELVDDVVELDVDVVELVDVELVVDDDVDVVVGAVVEEVVLDVEELVLDVEEVVVEDEDEDDVDVDVEVVVTTFTSGPVALHLDSARMISNTGRPTPWTGGRSSRWTPRTMMLVFPGVLLTICSFRMAVRTPGMVTTVLAAGVCSRGVPPRAALTRLMEPVEPSPFDVHVLEMASAVRALLPTTTLATLAELVAKPE